MSIISSETKNGGIYYTPPELANLVANLSIRNPNLRILDPCFGHGVLLLSSYQRLLTLKSISASEQLFGCDILRPPDNIISSLVTFINKENLTENDFFSLGDDYFNSKFDVIIMNPPFVRHHMISDADKKRINNNTKTINLPKTSDLWAYFVIRSLNYLQSEGSLAAILPWSFQYADYAKIVRKFLVNNFGNIKTLWIGEQLFDNTQERIMILLAEKYGSTLSNVKTAYSYKVPKNVITWSTVKVTTVKKTASFEFVATDECKYLEKLQKRIYFTLLSKLVNVQIGTVTGANKFFILNDKDVSDLVVPQEWLIPIIAKAEDVTKYSCIFRKDAKHKLLVIPENGILPSALLEYIKEAEKKGLQNGYHNKNRLLWYSLKPKNPPEAFLPYMIKELPTIILNPEKILSTNNIHGIYLHETYTKDTINWIQFSMLSSVSQLSIEMNSRTYGSGVLKIEPSSAKKILVFAGNGYKFPDEIEARVKKLIESGLRTSANELVDDWFIENKIISVEDNKRVKLHYAQLKEVRLRKS